MKIVISLFSLFLIAVIINVLTSVEEKEIEKPDIQLVPLQAFIDEYKENKSWSLEPPSKRGLNNQFLHNFDNQEFEVVTALPETAEDFLPFLPKEPAAVRTLFLLHVETGKEPVDAYILALEATLGTNQ